MKRYIKFLAVVVFGFTAISSEAYCSTRGRAKPKDQGILSSITNGLKRMASDSGARVKVHAGTSAYRAGRR